MAPIAADEVLQFLEKNPGFFLQHDESVRSSGLLDSNEPPENVLNIRHQLFERMNQERRELMNVLDETIEVVRANEKIESDFLAIERLVFHPSPSGSTLTRIAEEIEKRFALDHASFLIYEAAESTASSDEPGRVHLAGMDSPPHAEETIALAGNLEEGAPLPFPESCRADLRSVAIVTIREGEQILGLLLLGSKDPGRYADGMATHLLERLAMRLGIGIRLLQRLRTPARNGAPSVEAPSAGENRPLEDASRSA